MSSDELTPDIPEPDNVPLLTKFRQVARSYSDLFRSRRDHVTSLLGPTQNYSSGVFGEGLLREFLRELLPSAVSVDTGFIYGFDQVPTSSQIDIIVWDSNRHSPVYRTDSFVIVPPESAVATISVKSRMTPADLAEAADNLLSVTDLDMAYRFHEEEDLAQLPIAKFIVCFDPPSSANVLSSLAKHYRTAVAARPEIGKFLVQYLSTMDICHPSPRVWRAIERIYPRLIASLDQDVSFFRGWGPPGQQALSNAPHGVKRLPFLYEQGAKITAPLEKVIYQLLKQVYWSIDTPGQSLVSAWGDYDPRYHFRVGADLSELNEPSGQSLFDPGALP